MAILVVSLTADHPIYRTEIVRITGLSAASVGEAVRRLSREGYVEESAAKEDNSLTIKAHGRTRAILVTNRFKERAATETSWRAAFAKLRLENELNLSADEVDNEALKALAEKHGVNVEI